jgi:hypothetical protein
MARFATLLLASAITPILDVGLYNLNRNVTLPATGISNGDYVPVATVQRNGRIVASKMSIGATLGASAVVTLALYRAGVARPEPDGFDDRWRCQHRQQRGDCQRERTCGRRNRDCGQWRQHHGCGGRGHRRSLSALSGGGT